MVVLDLNLPLIYEPELDIVALIVKEEVLPLLKKKKSTEELGKQEADSTTNDNHDKHEEEILDVHPFEMICLTGKGTGLIATKNLYSGDLILAEAPALLVPDEIYENTISTSELIDKQITQLSSSVREMVLSLTDCRDPEDPSYLGMFYTNDMNYDGDAALCPMMARANHSCRPNAEFTTRRDLGHQRLVVMYNVKKGEEITINYMPISEEGSDVKDTRRAYLREWYNFHCLCRSCTVEGDELKEENILRESIKQLQAAGIENLSLDELEDLIAKLFDINGKLSYILDIVNIMYRKSEEAHSVHSVKYVVQGLKLALDLFGEGSAEMMEWMELTKIDDQQKTLLWADCLNKI